MNLDLAIDPYKLDGPWDERRVQAWFIFGVCVAGKSADQTAKKVTEFLSLGGYPELLPFNKIKYLDKRGNLDRALEKVRMGQYTRIAKALRGMVRIKPKTVTLEALESIHGVGPKTARMLLLYTRPGFVGIPLDTHILKWLRANGYDAPKSTPSAGPTYRRLEQAFIAEGTKRGLTPKEWDTQIWKMYAGRV